MWRVPDEFFQGCFFNIILFFSQRPGLFIIWSHWFGWYFPSSWTGFVIRKKYFSILCHTDTFFFTHSIHTGTLFFPYFIIMAKCAFQIFLSLDYHAHHFSNLWMIIFVRVKSKIQVTIGFFHIILCWRPIQTKNAIMQFIAFIFLRVLNNSLNE